MSICRCDLWKTVYLVLSVIKSFGPILRFYGAPWNYVEINFLVKVDVIDN